ncbi:MAG: ribonuclease E/G [Pseudomonadota bacterium]
MSHNKMLIDAAHSEETRVAVLRDDRIEEFDFESASRRPLRGNIYLAKVTRVEPSLQAAFVDYGGNRHGFLAFSEIHPDYYQIPIADREALLAEEAEDARASAAAEVARDEAEEADDDSAGDDQPKRRKRRTRKVRTKSDDSDAADELSDDDVDDDASAKTAALDAQDPAISDEVSPAPEADGIDAAAHDDNGDDDADEDDDEDDVDELEEVPAPRRRARKQYRIQEVIKRRQIILIQVVKEERGNKGAALTTYLSLAGRHTVLMPNTARGGGISRKITNAADRKRLRTIANDLDVPEGTGLIIRTAGAARTKAEIKRDFEYLMRLWENVRDLTLRSSAPTLVYEEGNLIKRSIRDLYSREIEEVLVSGDEAYREAKDFMRMIMPSHAKNVKRHDDAEPLFAKYRIERALNDMFSPTVTLPSGGYIVVNQTEALVAIDVNSGKSTRQSSIEETALSTNMEAAEEIARQLKLRDLAGLIVIDFIDMDERRNNRNVEKKMKDCLRHDRARIQVGRISHFGLMEMSRQRLRPGVLEGSTSPCPHCQGTGMIRSVNSVALSVIRSLEDALMRGDKANLTACTANEVALYILNEKRDEITEMEQRYGVILHVVAAADMQGANYRIERTDGSGGSSDVVMEMDWGNQEPGKSNQQPRKRGGGTSTAAAGGDDTRKPRRRRRRRRDEEENSSDDAEATEVEAATEDRDEDGDDEQPKKRRRRGRRGGRRNRRRDDADIEARDDGDDTENADLADDDNGSSDETESDGAEARAEGADEDTNGERRPRRRRTRGGRGRGRQGTRADAETATPDTQVDTEADTAVKAGDNDVEMDENKEPTDPVTATEPLTSTDGQAERADEPTSSAANGDDASDHASVNETQADHASLKDDAPIAVDAPDITPTPPKPARRGWWQRS